MNTKVEKPLFGFMTQNYLVLTLTSSLWGLAASITNTYFSLYVLELQEVKRLNENDVLDNKELTAKILEIERRVTELEKGRFRRKARQ